MINHCPIKQIIHKEQLWDPHLRAPKLQLCKEATDRQTWLQRMNLCAPPGWANKNPPSPNLPSAWACHYQPHQTKAADWHIISIRRCSISKSSESLAQLKSVKRTLNTCPSKTQISTIGKEIKIRLTNHYHWRMLTIGDRSKKICYHRVKIMTVISRK